VTSIEAIPADAAREALIDHDSLADTPTIDIFTCFDDFSGNLVA
jgi:hypothetical protein